MTNEKIPHRVGEIQALIEVSRLITVINLDKVLAETLNIVANAVSANKGSLFLLDEQARPYQRFITQRDMLPEMSRIVVSRVLDEGLAGWCVREKRGAIVDDTAEDHRWLIFDDDEQTDVRSVICVPFLFEDEVHAVMTLVNDQPNHFTRQDLQLATAIANQASSAIRNAHLFDDIQTQQRQLEIVLENAGEVMFMLNRDLVFMQANRKAAELIGIPQDELHGKNIRELKQMSIWGKLLEVLIHSGHTTETQVIELHDDENQRDFMANVARVSTETEGFVVVLHDVTVMKDLDRLKSHMMRMASHDIKNPLSIIWGYVELIRSDVDAGVMPDMMLVDGIVRALNRMDELIGELLDADRLERESRFRHSLVYPNKLVDQSLEEIAENMQRKHQRLITSIGIDLPVLHGDPTQLRQAMVNLMSNAVKYTPNDGTITVRANTDGNRFHFSVDDTGIGIPDNMQGQIFTQQYRAMRPEIEGIEGTGVGLSLVKEIIERHGGQVWFNSKVGHGSTFGFWIPIE